MKYNSTTEETSRDLVFFLRDQRKLTLKQIAELIGVTESFISRVFSRERRFTLKHLAKFELALGESVPLLLLRSREHQFVGELREAFQEAIGVLERCDKLKARLSSDKPRRNTDLVANVVEEPGHAPAREARAADVG